MTAIISRSRSYTDHWQHFLKLFALDEDGKVTWDWEYYNPLAKTVIQAAIDVGVTIEWGGDWAKFKDGPHYQLPWSKYPNS